MQRPPTTGDTRPGEQGSKGIHTRTVRLNEPETKRIRENPEIETALRVRFCGENDET